jgi:signal transduction histidine kinase
MLGHGCPYADPQGRWLGWIGTLLNITERQAFEHQWETFLGIVAHELKSPLTAIQGNLQLAQRRLARVIADRHGLSAEQLQERLTQVLSLLTRNQDNLQIQTRQIYELQDLSRVQVAQLDVRLAPCDLGECVRQVVQDQHVAHPQRRLLFDVPGDSPILVVGDEQRLRQVVTNYVTNAFQYSSPEQPVQVGITRAAASARVWVRDHGVGLSAEQQQQIWKPFSQVPGTTARTGLSGLGLGLHICKVLIQEQHGEVGVESAAGEGATFWFTLPLLQA